MSEDTTRLKLPFIAAAQAQKHVTHNEALLALDVLVQAAVLDRDMNIPPASPAKGDAYIVAATATGDWAGHEGDIAAWVDGVWRFHAPAKGWRAWVADEDALYIHDGAAWTKFEPGVATVNPVPGGKLGINTSADATNRLAVKSDAVLFSHDDVSGSGSGDVQFKINKATAANTASLLFQTGWSGRAEIGLTGDDDFTIKVSSDGALWRTALSITGDSGLPTVMAEKLAIVGALPKLELQDRAGGWQANITLEANPVLGGARRWGHMGVCIQRFDQNASPPAPVGSVVGIGWGFDSKVPYFGDSDGSISNVLTAANARVDTFTLAQLPDASTKGAGSIIFVSDETGGPTLAFSDGINWRRVQDRAVVS